MYRTTGKIEVNDTVLVRYGHGEKMHHATVKAFVEVEDRRGRTSSEPVISLLCHHHRRNFLRSRVHIVYTRRDEQLEPTCETCLSKLRGDE